MTQASIIDRINELFEELVPDSGKADTVAGEIVRAVSRIGFRWNNDGDRLGIGYGKETCNPAGRYLIAKVGNEIADATCKLWDRSISDDEYEEKLQDLYTATLTHIDSNPELKRLANNVDMFDFRDKYEDVDDSDDFDECEEW